MSIKDFTEILTVVCLEKQWIRTVEKQKKFYKQNAKRLIYDGPFVIMITITQYTSDDAIYDVLSTTLNLITYWIQSPT